MAVALAAAPVPALAGERLSDSFAWCTGLFTALRDHQWMFADPKTDETSVLTAEMTALLGAVWEPGRADHLRSTRDGARDGMRDLMNRASFNGDYSDALWARDHIDRQLAPCRDMLGHS